MKRALAVAHMHLTDRLTLFGLPPAILAASFVVSFLVFAAEPEHARTSGGAVSIYVIVFVAAVMLTTRGLAFALGMGASRRAFALGTGIVGALLAAGFGVLMFILNRIEAATGGWGMQAHFFTIGWLSHANPAAVWLILTLPFLAIFLLGASVSTLWLRWGSTATLFGGVAAVLVLGAIGAIVTWTHSWRSVGHWFEQLSPLTASGWVALLCVPLAAVSYFAVRRVAL